MTVVKFVVEKEREMGGGNVSTACTAHHSEYTSLFCHPKLAREIPFCAKCFPEP